MKDEEKNKKAFTEQKSKHVNKHDYEDISSSSRAYSKRDEYEDINSYSKKARRKRKGYGLRIAISCVIIFFLVIASLLMYVRERFDYNYDDQFYIDVQPIDESVVNVALFGVDSRVETNFTGLTDSIMILSINKKTEKIKIISVMRDTLVPIYNTEGKQFKYGKINSAYSLGKQDVTKSAQYAVNTLNAVYDLDISQYAVVNFYGMIDIIDAVGGIEATITKDELTWKGAGNPNLNNCMDEICKEKGLNPKNYYIHSAGQQTLNGVQAVAYSRIRHCTNVWGTRDDFGRTDRQRHVMEQLFNKALTIEKSKYAGLIDALIPCSKTSLSPGNILDLAFSVLLNDPTFEQYRLPPTEHQAKFLMNGPSGYGSVIYYDIDYAAKLINAVIYEDLTMDQFIEKNPIERNNWYYDMTGTSGKAPNNSTTKPPQTTPNDPQEPEAPNKPVDPIEPENPTDPEDPVDPTDPEDPNDTENPTDPEDPNDTEDPTDPTNPEDPNDTEKPTDPEDPNDTEEPTDPINPEKPIVPEEPTIPEGSETP